MIVKKDKLILDSGCIVAKNNTVFAPIRLLENGDRYEAQFKCSNASCINEAHISYKLTHDIFGEIINTERETYHQILGDYSVEGGWEKSKKEKKIHLAKLHAEVDVLWEEYLRIGSFKGLARQYHTNTTFLRSLFRKHKKRL